MILTTISQTIAISIAEPLNTGAPLQGPAPGIKTVAFILIFLVLYLAVLLRKTIHSRIDLHDLLLLSSVALLPSFFVLFPSLTYRLSELVGVAFPFVILFGALFLVVFVYLYRLGKRLNELKVQNIRIIQEIGMLRQEIESSEARASTHNIKS